METRSQRNKNYSIRNEGDQMVMPRPSIRNARKRNAAREQGSESSEPENKSRKDTTEKNPQIDVDRHLSAVAEGQELQSYSEPENMDCLDDVTLDTTAEFHHHLNKKEPQDDADSKQSSQFIRLNVPVVGHQRFSHTEPQCYSVTKQSSQFIGPIISERSTCSPNIRVRDEIDCSQVGRDWSPKDEDDISHSDEEATDSDVDRRSGGDSPIFSRTRSRILSDQLLTPQFRIRRSLQSTQDQKNDGILSSKASVKFVPPVLPRTELSLKEGERDRRFLQEGSAGTSNNYVALIAIIVVMSCSLLFLFLVNKPQTVIFAERTALTAFLDKFDQVETLFYGQQSALWKRSKIILRNHINLTQHGKPAILMFAAAWDGQRTMRCLTRQIADAYSAALNASAVIEINATVERDRDSDIVKLQVDTQLSYGFDKGSKVAVVHHFQDLPPLSSLIFYKYCDHENAAYKAVTLLITILLDEEKLAPDISLTALEVKVRDFLKRRFSASEGGQGMDTDKLSGLWSRIAHVVLPVTPVREIEEEGCDSKEDGK